MRLTTLSFILSTAFLAACDPRVFDDLKEQTWVDSSGKPESLSAVGYASGLVGGGSDEDLHYLVVAQNPPALVSTRFDGSGSAERIVSLVSDTLANVEPLSESPLISADPGGFGEERGNVALAVVNGTRSTLHMVRGLDGSAGPRFELEGTGEARGIAFGDSDVSAETDLLATVETNLHVVADYKNESEPDAAIFCDAGGDVGGVAVADLSTAQQEEVIVQVNSELVVMLASSIVDASNSSVGCFDLVPSLGRIEAPDNEADFGQEILVGDLDGNGQADIVVSAPSAQRVYLYLNWTAETPTEEVKIDAPSGSGAFAADIALGDFDGDGSAELVVTDAESIAEGVASAGTVYVYTVDAGGSVGDAIELYDAEPEEDQHFGLSVATSSAFGQDVLIVGAKNEVFTYFRTPLSDEDFRER